MQATAMTLYIDGQCPLCVAEMTRLRAWDQHGQLAFVDIAGPGFDPAPLGVNLIALNQQLHAWTADGRWLIGTDTIVAAYTCVGKGWIVAPLRVPMLRPLWRAAYLTFARNRMRISRWLGYDVPGPCRDGACDLKL
jgi:predicted DCC family thiol-disulfide oxidoreductase YuxK